MTKRIAVFTGKFAVGQRVRNVTGLTGTVEEVDPDSYTPPPGRAVHNPYRVQFDHWPTAQAVWEPENELELATESPKKRRDAAKERLWDHTRKKRQADIRKRRNDAARAAGFKSSDDLLTQLVKDEALQALIKNRRSL